MSKLFTVIYNNTSAMVGDRFWLKDPNLFQKNKEGQVLVDKNGNRLTQWAGNMLSPAEAELKNKKTHEKLGLGVASMIPTMTPKGPKFVVLWEGTRSPSFHFGHELDWQDLIDDDGLTYDPFEEVPPEEEATPLEAQTTVAPGVTPPKAKGGATDRVAKAKGAEEDLSGGGEDGGDFSNVIELGEGEVDGGVAFEDTDKRGLSASEKEFINNKRAEEAKAEKQRQADIEAGTINHAGHTNPEQTEGLTPGDKTPEAVVTRRA